MFWVQREIHARAPVPKPQAFFIEAYTTEDELLDFAEATKGDKCAEEEEPLISFHAIAGCNGPKTMRIKAAIGRRTLVII